MVDEAKLWEAYRRGKAKDAFDALVLFYFPLIRKAAHRTARRTKGMLQPEELYGDGYEAIRTCVVRFDASKGVPFEHYAARRVYGAMQDVLREWMHSRVKTSGVRLRNVQHPMSLQEVIYESEEGLTFTLLSTEALAVQDADHGDNDLARLVLESVNTTDSLILRRYYMDGRTLKEIGDEIGLSESRVCQRVARIMEHVRGNSRLQREAA